ncbi:MAG: hypothetical protein LBI03_03085 [Clostridiales bacterium]|jgi:hypothetical protein|nr:hypothetical protein [Clostridiales bacterium]
MSEITYTIKNHLAVLSSTGKGWKKEFNLVSWNGGPVKADIREWSPDKKSMKKGITLDRDEVVELKKFISIMDVSLIDEKYHKRENREHRGTSDVVIAVEKKPETESVIDGYTEVAEISYKKDDEIPESEQGMQFDTIFVEKNITSDNISKEEPF